MKGILREIDIVILLCLSITGALALINAIEIESLKAYNHKQMEIKLDKTRLK